LITNFGLKKYNFLYYSFHPSFFFHFFLFLILFVNPLALIKKIFTAKNKFLTFLNTAPVEIGNIYTEEILEKYYTIKKLQLFNLIIDCSNKDKKLDSYSNLINNYMFVIQYINQNIDEKFKDKEDMIKINDEKAYDENLKLKNEENIIVKNQLLITGDISYNQSFITKYEIYNDYSLIKNL